MQWTEALLKEPGIRDEPGKDGLTGFAVALGFMNVDMVIKYLQSKVEPRDSILFLAREVLKVPSQGDQNLEILQEAISNSLKSIRQPHCQEISVQKMWCKKSKYPMINPNIEEHERYHKNKKWLKDQLRLNTDDDDLREKLGRMQHFILGKFCIETNSSDGIWRLQDIRAVSCIHKHERFVSQIMVVMVFSNFITHF